MPLSVCFSKLFDFGGALACNHMFLLCFQPEFPQVRLHVVLPLEIAQRKTGVSPNIVKLNVVPKL